MTSPLTAIHGPWSISLDSNLMEPRHLHFRNDSLEQLISECLNNLVSKSSWYNYTCLLRNVTQLSTENLFSLLSCHRVAWLCGKKSLPNAYISVLNIWQRGLLSIAPFHLPGDIAFYFKENEFVLLAAESQRSAVTELMAVSVLHLQWAESHSTSSELSTWKGGSHARAVDYRSHSLQDSLFTILPHPKLGKPWVLIFELNNVSFTFSLHLDFSWVF